MSDQPYSKRELDEKFSALSEHLVRQDNSLIRIELQTTKHNGRMSKLERWQSYVLGFCACIAIIVIPVLITLMRHVLIN